MAFKGVNDRLLTGAVVVVSLAGLLYFGLSAILQDDGTSGGNPFEYDIKVFEADGSEKLFYRSAAEIALPLDEPAAIAAGPGDAVYVAGGRELIVLDRAGKMIRRLSLNGPATALAVDRNGHAYLCIREHVEVLDSAGTGRAEWIGLGENAILTSIALGPDGVYIADAGGLVVWRFDRRGRLLGRIGERDDRRDIPGFLIPSPYFDVAIDSDGFLWAVNTGRHQLENYTSGGELRSSWSKSSMTVTGFCGCCNPTHIAILEDGSFVTSEKGIARVKIHNRIGEFTALVAGPDQFDEGTVGLDLAVDSSGRILVLDPKRKQLRIYIEKEEQA